MGSTQSTWGTLPKHTVCLKKLLALIAVAIAGYAQATDVVCTAPETITREPIYKNINKPVIDLDKLQAEIDARNAEIAANKPEAQILDFEEIKAKYGDKLVEKLEKIKAKQQAKVFQ